MREEGRRIEVRGTVQGVGFRPWVHRLAREQGLGGRVWNHSTGVTIEVFGPDDALGFFVEQLGASGPSAARITTLDCESLPMETLDKFQIIENSISDQTVGSTLPEVAICSDCLREIFDPADRRHRYPFTSCMNCGPRFVASREIRYRRAPAMPMCDACRLEYETPGGRRFHAQANACPECGPKLRVLGPTGASVSQKDPIAMAGRAIRCHFIVAVRGVGGFDLVCDATSSMAVKRLRERHGSDENSFAVMVPDLETAERAALISREEKELLRSSSRPLVPVSKHPDGMLCSEIAPDSHLVGLMRPLTPLHHLLLAELGRPLVMTSGILAGEEPITRGNDEAVDRLGDIADIFLVPDREIDGDDCCAVDGGDALADRTGTSDPHHGPTPWTPTVNERRPRAGAS